MPNWLGECKIRHAVDKQLTLECTFRQFLKNVWENIELSDYNDNAFTRVGDLSIWL